MTDGEGGKGGEGGEAFDWSGLAPRILHPLKVAAIEALLYIGQPLSATDITKLFDDPELSVSRISYHLNSLARQGILVRTHERRVHGAVERFYSCVRKLKRQKT